MTTLRLPEEPGVCDTCGHYLSVHPCRGPWRRETVRLRLPFGWQLHLLRPCRCKGGDL